MEGETCKCGQPAGPDNTCPYDEDIYGKETICNCCKACREACMHDI